MTVRLSRLIRWLYRRRLAARAHAAAAVSGSVVLALLALVGAPAVSAQAAPRDISALVDIEGGASFDVREETYSLPDVELDPPDGETLPGLGVPAEMLAVVVTPVNAQGPRPVAVFIHGMSSACFDPNANEVQNQWPCGEGAEPVPSYRGYLGYQRFLAARGWVTVSVSLNSLAGTLYSTNYATDAVLRAAMVERHLRQWVDWIAGDNTLPPPAFLAAGVQPDLEQLLLVGHSRGGSAANQIALKSVTDPASPWRARAQLLIAPIATHHNPTPALPTVVLLPGCDGDVLDLQGQSYIDRARDLIADPALSSGIFIDGANHAFFNSEWDPATANFPRAAKDDSETLFTGRAHEGACRPGAPERLSNVAQRELGNFYIAAAARAFVQGDANILPLFDGSAVCAGPTCRARVRTQALGGRRQAVLIPALDSVGATDGQLSITPCLTARDVSSEGACITADMPTIHGVPRTPHFIPAVEVPEDAPKAQEPSHVALRAQWGSSLGSASIRTSHGSLSSDASELVVRVIVPPEAVDTSFALSLRDRAGASLPLGAATLSGVPANAGLGTGVYWAQELRFAIDVAAAAAAGFDVHALSSLELSPRSASGVLWLLDAWSYASGAAPVGAAASFELVRGTYTPDAASMVHIPVAVFGDLREPAKIYYYVQLGDSGHEDIISVAAGARTFDVSLPAGQAKSTLDVQFIGIKGMVPTRRSHEVRLVSPEQPESP